MVETSEQDLCTEMVYRWKRHIRNVGHEQGMKELRREARRMIMTPEAIAKFNGELKA